MEIHLKINLPLCLIILLKIDSILHSLKIFLFSQPLLFTPVASNVATN